MIHPIKIIGSCNLNIRPEFKTAVNACLLFEPQERPSVSKLINFSFNLLVDKASSACMHYKRTSASQTPHLKTLGKGFDFSKYFNKNQQQTNQPKTNLFASKNNIFLQTQKTQKKKNSLEFKKDGKITSGFNREIKNEFPVTKQKIVSKVSPGKNKIRNLSPATKNYFESRHPKKETPKRWNKIMKSVDLKAKNSKNTFPRQERLRIIKSPPPNVT